LGEGRRAPRCAADLAVRLGDKRLAGDLLQDLRLELLVVVDLAVDGHHDGLVLVEQGLVARGGVDDGQALVRQEVVAELVHARPAGPSKAHGVGASQG
jgi:hypothetical protein